MSKQLLYLVASLLLLAGLALIVLGLQQENVLWQAGAGAVALAMLLSFATRWIPAAKTDKEQKGPDA